MPAPRALSVRDSLLADSLALAVPLEIASQREVPLEQIMETVPRWAQTVAGHSDELQFGGAHCRETFAALTRGLAALSFAPGGAEFAGQHWCSQHPESPSRDGQYAGVPR